MNRYSITRLKPALYLLLYTDIYANNKKKTSVGYLKDKTPNAVKCLLRQNNRLLKCQVVPLRRQLKKKKKKTRELWFCHLMSHELGTASQG